MKLKFSFPCFPRGESTHFTNWLYPTGAMWYGAFTGWPSFSTWLVPGARDDD